MEKNTINTGEVFSPESSVECAGGSVVSKTILQKETGNVTLFAFDKGEGLSEHTATFDALALIINGKAKITIDKQTYYPGKGEAILMPANVPHALHAEERFKMMLIMIKSGL